MEKTLHWKKTIAILAIVLGILRLIDTIDTYISLQNRNLINEFYSDGKFIKSIVVAELISLAIIFILGVMLLCIDNKTNKNTSHKESRQACVWILITSIIYLFLEIGVYFMIQSFIQNNISWGFIIGSLGFILVLIIFCILGLTPKTESSLQDDVTSDFKTQQTSTLQSEPTAIDLQIVELKKQIKKRKLEKEMEQIKSEKQSELEKLKKELKDLE